MPLHIGRSLQEEPGKNEKQTLDFVGLIAIQRPLKRLIRHAPKFTHILLYSYLDAIAHMEARWLVFVVAF